MTYQTNKREKSASQAGVTILLAILILSSILAITFSLSSILFIELRSSTDLVKSEGSLYGSSAVAEEAVYSIKRSVCPDTNQNCFDFVSNFSSNSVLTTQPAFSSTSTPVIQEKVPKYTSLTTTKNIYDFCGTAATQSGCGYGRVQIVFNDIGNSSSVFAYLCEFSPTMSYGSAPCSDPNNTLYFTTQHKTQLSASYGQITWDLNTSMQQTLYLYNQSSADAYVTITTYDANMTTLKGLPFVGKTAVDISTQNGQLGRKVRVIVPK